MKKIWLRTGGALVACAAITTASAAAMAQDEPARGDRDRDRDRDGEDADGARFRGGIRAEGGVLVAPDPGEALPFGGVQGHIGAQINDLVGVYWAPSLDIIFGSIGGPNLGSAILVDFTFDDTWQIGVGPDVGVFAAVGEGGAGAAALYGGRLHFAAFPLVGEGDDGIRRKGLALGLDVRLLTGGIAFADTGGASASADAFVMQPTVFVGYEAF